MTYPIKLNDRYTCQGIDANGKSVVFSDLLSVGEKVGPLAPGFEERDFTGEDAMFIDGVVVRRPDGLWVEALPGVSVTEEEK
jgi:hypothetical protein